MPNASRYLEPGYTYHLTHRCHDRRFLLKFSKDRDDYRAWLREGARRYHVAVYNYCVTSNHVHVVVHVGEPDAVSAMMQLASGTLARHWNRRKGHEGSVWEHPYRCTRVQDGAHLLRCLCYVSLNMVRAGVVSHPRDWKWCGHDELTGGRLRYRLLALDRLLESLGVSTVEILKQLYSSRIEEALERGDLKRDPAWTEALAVGDRQFVEKAAAETQRRSQFTYEAIPGGDGGWMVREACRPYTGLLDPEKPI